MPSWLIPDLTVSANTLTDSGANASYPQTVSAENLFHTPSSRFESSPRINRFFMTSMNSLKNNNSRIRPNKLLVRQSSIPIFVENKENHFNKLLFQIDAADSLCDRSHHFFVNFFSLRVFLKRKLKILTHGHGEEGESDFYFVNRLDEIEKVMNFLKMNSRVFFLLKVHLLFACFFVDGLDLNI